MQYRPYQLWVGALRAERERKGNAALEAGQHVRRAGSGDHPDRGYPSSQSSLGLFFAYFWQDLGTCLA